MRSIYRERFGFSDEDGPAVDSFIAAMRRQGASNERIEQCFEWYKNQGRYAKSPAELQDSFRAFTHDWPENDRDSALAWHDIASTDGVQIIPLDPEPTAMDDVRRLAEIRAKDRSEYFNEKLDDEQLAILERMQARGTDLSNWQTVNDTPEGYAAKAEMERSDPAPQAPVDRSQLWQNWKDGGIEPPAPAQQIDRSTLWPDLSAAPADAGAAE